MTVNNKNRTEIREQPIDQGKECFYFLMLCFDESLSFVFWHLLTLLINLITMTTEKYFLVFFIEMKLYETWLAVGICSTGIEMEKFKISNY